MAKRAWLVCVGVAQLAAASGCATEQVERTRGVESHLRLIGTEYGTFLSRNGNRPPADEQQFREFLQSRMARLSPLGVTSLDEFLTSPRDNQPLVIISGQQKLIMSPGGFPWAAHEQAGVGGKRMAVSTRGTVVELSAEEFEATFSSGSGGGPGP